ncbi:MAG: glutamine ABC transporter ATP-binding protein [Candidatus Adiutrix intracellularis]|jgi:polar amino acid transport system ATP-binding protein|nr:MAG: glutamine ABC transporter ATP-binding protein [Candidatus Adiutrix intracellularis]MDR2826544.1 amino acid ABC transporter ATP-binding protein [Candidatus Adiutrix intracellularis]
MFSDQPVLKIKELYKKYDEREVLHGISLEVKKGEVLVMVGPSGCGKSTLLRCLNGLEPIDSGDIELNGESIIFGKIRWNLVRQRIGMVFQSYDLFPHMTVLENILLGPLKAQKRGRAEVAGEAKTYLDRVGLLDRWDSYPNQLSGGQRQRVAIVRALCMNPEIMLFDEVTASLDPEMVREVLDVMLGLAVRGLTMLIVTHEMAFARAVADRVIFMDEGIIVENESPANFFENPATDRARKFLNIFYFDGVKKGPG